MYCFLLIFLSIPFGLACVQGDCTRNDTALITLAKRLSHGAAISCRGSSLQLYNAGRYWGEQYGKNASVVVFPLTREDVSHAVRAAALSPLGRDLAFVSGAHGQTNASSSTGFIIDLSWMNSTKILHNVTLDDTVVATAISYQGGATWGQVTDVTNGTGYTAVGARVGDVGVGGFSTGGGIGFIAGAYGYAIDRLRAMEVVLMSGKIVLATKTNQYSDLFWALQGGGGQFGIVTTFYQEAAPEPTSSEFGIWIVAKESWEKARQNTVKFFNSNDDPFALMYYSVGYYPANLTSGPLSTKVIIVGIRFPNPTASYQKDFNSTFAPLICGLHFEQSIKYNVPYGEATTLSTPFFPYGYRRGFWGPQTTNVTTAYITAASAQMETYINASVARGEVPNSAVWVLQYMSPGQNGHAPTSDTHTAWPHATSAHQTLFSPAWTHASDDGFVEEHNRLIEKVTRDYQDSLGIFVADYPNYIAPGVTGYRVWGDNVRRLIRVKERYDPECRIHQGRVFGSEGCVRGGWANVFAEDQEDYGDGYD